MYISKIERRQVTASRITIFVFIGQVQCKVAIIYAKNYEPTLAATVVRFSEFLGIGYFGDERQNVIAPIFDSRHNAERGWTMVVDKGMTIFHVVFIEHWSKYEFIAYPLEIKEDKINYVLYRSFSSLASLHKFKRLYGGRTYIKFGWHDLTKPDKFDVMSDYLMVDEIEFLVPTDVKLETLADRIRRNEL